MSIACYYGDPDLSPTLWRENEIDFRQTTLQMAFTEGTEQEIQDYKEFIEIIFCYLDNLVFKRVICSEKTIYLQDTKNELWGAFFIQ